MCISLIRSLILQSLVFLTYFFSNFIEEKPLRLGLLGKGMVKVVVRDCQGANFVAHAFKYLAPNFVS